MTSLMLIRLKSSSPVPKLKGTCRLAFHSCSAHMPITVASTAAASAASRSARWPFTRILARADCDNDRCAPPAERLGCMVREASRTVAVDTYESRLWNMVAYAMHVLRTDPVICVSDSACAIDGARG